MTQVFTNISRVMTRSVLAFAMFTAFTSLAYLLFLPFGRNSDMAGTMLAGIDMAAGNWLLTGWWLPSDNFFTSDVVLYAALAWLERGAPIMLYQAPALLWGGIATLAVWLSIGERGLVAGRTGLATVITLLVFPVILATGPAYKISESPIHNGTVLLLLVCFSLLDMATRYPSRRPSWQPLVCVLASTLPMMLAVAGDPLALFIGTVPVVTASILRLRQKQPDRIHWVILMSTILAALLARLAIYVTPTIGGFHAATLRLNLATPMRLINHIRLVAKWLIQFIGADFFEHPLPSLAHPGTAIFLIRLPIALLFLLEIVLIGKQVVQAYRYPQDAQPNYLSAVLWLAVIGNLSSLVVSGMIVDEASGRLVIPAFVFGSVLLARTEVFGRLARSYVAVALVCSMGFTGRLLACRPATPALATPALLDLTQFLAKQGISTGYGPYWSSSITTVLTNERVRVNSLWLNEAGEIRPFPWLWKSAWYQTLSARHDGQVFFVVDTASRDSFSAQDVVSLMGLPLAKHVVGQYLINVYDARNPAMLKLAP